MEAKTAGISSTINLDEAKKNINCLGCNINCINQDELFKHMICCDDYYKLDTIKEKIQQECLEKSKTKKIVIINKKLKIDFHYVNAKLHKCIFDIDLDTFVNNLKSMNPSLNELYEDEEMIIFT
jgi:hypothetical protein